MMVTSRGAVDWPFLAMPARRTSCGTEIQEEAMPGSKRRNRWLTAYLCFMAITNAAAALLYLFAGDSVRRSYPALPAWSIPVLAACALTNLVCVIALFKW